MRRLIFLRLVAAARGGGDRMIFEFRRSSLAAARRLREKIHRVRLVFDQLGLWGIALRLAARILGRSVRAPAPMPVPIPMRWPVVPGSAYDVIYAIGDRAGEPQRYRVFNPAESLDAHGYAVGIIDFERIFDLTHLGVETKTLVLFRAAKDRLCGIGAVLAWARRRGVRVLYDIDDLIFDPELAERIDGLRVLIPYERRRFAHRMARCGDLMRAADLGLMSTAALAREAERLGRPSMVVPNALNCAQIEMARTLGRAPRRSDGTVLIVYASGSPTHQRDFLECAPALLDIMRERPAVRFRLVGYLDLGPQWDAYRERVERFEYMPPLDLLACIAEADINLAPLELGNLFCDAKSELKFFEAGLVGVPTLASATAAFVGAIEDGVSGFVVRDRAEWHRALDTLVGSEARRRAMGEAARQRVEARYTPAAVFPRLVEALGLPLPASAGAAAVAALTAAVEG
jgi:glycosyltransferase involved in cell wall biosynthesis